MNYHDFSIRFHIWLFFPWTTSIKPDSLILQWLQVVMVLSMNYYSLVQNRANKKQKFSQIVRTHNLAECLHVVFQNCGRQLLGLESLIWIILDHACSDLKWSQKIWRIWSTKMAACLFCRMFQHFTSSIKRKSYQQKLNNRGFC